MNLFRLFIISILLTNSLLGIAKKNNFEISNYLYSKYDDPRWSLVPDSVKDIIQKKNIQVRFMPPLTTASYSKSFHDKYYEVTCTTLIDSSCVLISFNNIDGIESALIDYNHFYDIKIKNEKNASLKIFRLSKKEDLTSLKNNAFWAVGGVNAWSFIAYNEKYDKFVFSYNDYPRHNYGNYHYFILDKNGNINFQGYDKGWGGNGEDGKIHVGQEFIISCNEIYSFKENLSKSFKELTALIDFQIFAMRMLGDSAVLVIFCKTEIGYDSNGKIKSFKNTSGDIENAFIISMDGEIIRQFTYQDIYEEMEYHFLSNETYSLDSLLYYDTQRNKLGIIEKFHPYRNKEIGYENMKEVSKENEAEFNNMKILFQRNWISRFDIRISNQGCIFYKNQ